MGETDGTENKTENTSKKYTGAGKGNRKQLDLIFKLIIGIICGIIIGSVGGWFGFGDNPVYIVVVRILATFGSLFGTFLTFIIPLLIVSFISVGLAELGSKASRLFVYTLICAYAFTVIAGLISYFTGAAILPNIIHPLDTPLESNAAYGTLFTLEVDPVLGIMSALVLAFILGLGMATMKSHSLLDAVRDLRLIIVRVIEKIIIPLIPVYIACLFSNVAASGELWATLKIFLMLLVFIIVMQYVHLAVEFGIASIITRGNRYSMIKGVVPAYLTALGTKSSAATIPVNLECARSNGVSTHVSSFVIPLCATIHLSGDTVCLVLGSMGIMLANGMTPTFAQFMPFILALGVMMIAAPGVPGGGVMAALGLITSLLGFNDAMQQLIISLHLTQDSFGTACNVTGDQAIAAIIDKLDGQDMNKAKSGGLAEDIDREAA